MKRVALAAALLLLFSGGALAQQQQRQPHHRPSHRPDRPAPAQPAAPFVPQTLSTGGITTLPAPPPPGPFDARPGTYAPRYNDARPRHYGSTGYAGIPYYDSLVGIGEFVPPATPSFTGVAPSYAAPYVASPEPPTSQAPAPEPPRVAAVHGPDTFYVIPGCYLGNHPPNPARLPKGCDIAKLKTLPIR